MRTKIFILTILFCASLTASVSLAQVTTAQTPAVPTLDQSTERRLEHVAKKLNLTEAQTNQVRTIWQQSDPQIAADRVAVASSAVGTPDHKTAKKQLAADQKNRNTQLKAVLTPDQLKQFKEMMLQNLQKREQRIQKEEQKLENNN